MEARVSIIILILGLILGNAPASCYNGEHFQVDRLENQGFRIISLQPGPISSRATGSGSSKLLNRFEKGKMVVYAWMRPGGTLLVSAGNHFLRITVENHHQYKIEEDPP